MHRTEQARRLAATALAVTVPAIVCGLLVACGAAAPAATSSGSPLPSVEATESPTGDAVGPPAPVPTGSSVPAPGAAPAPGDDGPTEAAPLPTTAAALGDLVAFETGIAIEVVSVEPIEVEAQTPGEISGPAVAVEVTARNDSAQPQDVTSAVVMLVAADGEPGVGTTAGEPAPFTGVIAPGATASARYVFMLDPAEGRELTVSVNYAAGEPVAVFTGTPS